MKVYYFAAYAAADKIQWCADVAVGNSVADRRAAAAARAVPRKNLFFSRRNGETADFRAKLLQNCPEIPHLELSVKQLVKLLENDANVEHVKNLSYGEQLQDLEQRVQSHRLTPFERGKIVNQFNHCHFIRYGKN